MEEDSTSEETKQMGLDLNPCLKRFFLLLLRKKREKKS